MHGKVYVVILIISKSNAIPVISRRCTYRFIENLKYIEKSNQIKLIVSESYTKIYEINNQIKHKRCFITISFHFIHVYIFMYKIAS